MSFYCLIEDVRKYEILVKLPLLLVSLALRLYYRYSRETEKVSLKFHSQI